MSFGGPEMFLEEPQEPMTHIGDKALFAGYPLHGGKWRGRKDLFGTLEDGLVDELPVDLDHTNFLFPGFFEDG